MKHLKQNSAPQDQERGSAIVYILLAISLFALLSFAVSKMFSGGQTSSEREMSKLGTSEMLQFTNNLKRAIQEMKIEGVTYAEISFENNEVEGYENTACGSENCRVFSGSGGNVTYQAPLREWLAIDQGTRKLYGEWYFPGQICAVNVGSDTGSTCDSDVDDNEDVIVILPWIKENLCIGINKQLGIDNPNGRPPQIEEGGWDSASLKFTGEIGDGSLMDLEGRRVGCFEGRPGGYPPEGTYHFYQILWGR